jgi:hypothetical protein
MSNCVFMPGEVLAALILAYPRKRVGGLKQKDCLCDYYPFDKMGLKLIY